MNRLDAYAWRACSAALRAEISDASAAGSSQQNFCFLIQELNEYSYPVDGLSASEVHEFLCDLTRKSTRHNSHSVPKIAQLCFSLLSTQQVNPPQDVEDKVFAFFTGWLPSAEPATEPLYVLALLQPSRDVPRAVCERVASMAVELTLQLDVRRAALHYLAVLCDRRCEDESELAVPLEALSGQLLGQAQSHSGQLLGQAQSHSDSLTVAKLVLSQLRTTYHLVKVAGGNFLQPLLPALLAALKFYMVAGLPGRPDIVVPLPSAAIPNVTKPRKERCSGKMAVSQSFRHQQRPQHSLASKPLSAPATSDSEVSDSEPQDSTISKALSCKLRHQALVCLASVFVIVGPRNTFSYWLSFLPDGPRLSHTTPSLLSCILRDPNHKCRSAALAVLCAMLEGSRPYLAAADDQQSSGLAFTPFSSRLGGVLQELHHCLLLAVGTEAQPVVLTRAIRCLAILASNMPYHQLSSGYTSRILATLRPLSHHRDIDVRVACLTCCGAVLSTYPPLPEVAAWLSEPQQPWLLGWCRSLLQPNASSTTAALQTESLQALTAATKCYFSSLVEHWATVVELCVAHLVTLQQQHSLKLLEELSRASAELPQAVQLWSHLLEGPLTAILQNPASPSVCSQACAVLATLSSTSMQQLRPPLRMLALTLPLGLSREEDALPTVTSSAVRVLGVYCTFSCLREDEAFLQDSGVAILHALASSSQLVRVQASWALANLTDTLLASTGWNLSSYLSAASCALKDKDVVKCNAVRTIGNLLKTIPQLDDKKVSSVCMQLAQCISSGTMKLRWNACYACYRIFKNSSFSATHCAATDLLLNALCETACTCQNFKVCTHASLALSSLPSYTPAQFERVWSATLTSLEQSLHHKDFAEFRQAANLRSQLCRSLCCVLCVQSDLNAVSPHPLSGPVMACLTDCFNNAPQEDRAVLEAAERKLSSWPAAVQSNPTLAGILSVLQSSLSRNS